MRSCALIILVALAGLVSCSPAAADPASPQVQIHTVAGGGSCSGPMVSGGPCDGVAATSVPIGNVASVSAMPNGGYLYVDSANDLVREVSPAGIVTTVAGTSYVTPQLAVIPSTTDVENVPATQSGLDHPVAVAALPAGGFLITEGAGSRVRLVTAQGTITTIAGCPATATDATDTSQQDRPEPGAATCPGASPGSSVGASQELDYPSDAEPTANGGVLIADTYNDRIMLLSAPSPTATITQIAGGGSACNDAANPCDGQPAGNVSLDLPYSVSGLLGSSAYVVGEEGSAAIREISAQSPSGTFSTVVGQPGAPGYAGDGGPALLARIGGGSAGVGDQVAGLPNGAFLFSDPYNEVVREVSASGVVSTIAGDGQASFSGDGGPPSAAALNDPVSASPVFNGNILIADQGNGVIREITQPPATAIALLPASPDGAHGWYVTPPSVTVTTNVRGGALACERDPAAAPSVFAAIAPGCPYAGFTAAVDINGPHTVWAASQDLFGDQGTPISRSFKVDVGPPTITCGREPVVPFSARRAVVTGTMSDPVSGPSSERVTARARLSSLGVHSLLLRGRNQAGTKGQARCDYFVAPVFLSPAPKLSSELEVHAKYSVVKRLVVGDIPAGSTVDVRCMGHGCGLNTLRRLRTVPCHTCASAHALSADVGSLVRGRKLMPGARIAISVTRYGAIGSFLELTVHAKRKPSRTERCLPPGSTTPNARRCMPKLPY